MNHALYSSAACLVAGLVIAIAAGCAGEDSPAEGGLLQQSDSAAGAAVVHRYTEAEVRTIFAEWLCPRNPGLGAAFLSAVQARVVPSRFASGEWSVTGEVTGEAIAAILGSTSSLDDMTYNYTFREETAIIAPVGQVLDLLLIRARNEGRC